MLYEPVFTTPEKGYELSEASNPQLFFVRGIFELEWGALVDNALGHEEDGSVRFPLDLEKLKDRVRHALGWLAIEKDQGCVELALHKCPVESVIERGCTSNLVQQAPKGLFGRLEQREGTSEDKVRVGQVVLV